MKMLVVAPQPFFSPRGTPFSVYYRALVMSELGVRIDLLTYGDGQDIDVSGIRTIRIPRLRFLEPIPVGPSWRKLFLDGFMLLWTFGLLAKNRYPVVHAHEEAVFWCRPLRRIFGFRLIYDMHSSLPQQLDNFKFTKSRLIVRIFQTLEDRCLKAADAVITICPALRDYALESGVSPARQLLIENSIFDDVRLKQSPQAPGSKGSFAEVEFDSAHPVILYAGTFEAYQGIEILVHAFARLVVKRPDARLLLVGGTDEQVKDIQAVVTALGLMNTCRLTGRVSKTHALAYTQSAHVLVSPRLHGTNTPLKIYEQPASGKPLVATRIWSHTQVLDDRVCYLVEPDPESLASGLFAALQDLGRNTGRADNARALYEREYARPVYESKIRRLLEIVA
jgi:glycosyltransferase involved in cell wall biosynthesis